MSNQGWIAPLLLLVSGLAAHEAAHAMETPSAALAEIDHVSTLFGAPIKHITRAPGIHQLGASDSFTAASLAGLPLQPNPPELGTVPTYRPEQQDVAAAPPYVSAGLQNFRFDYFHNVYNFKGWHTWPSADYASVHGFRALSNYGRDTPDVTWLPPLYGWKPIRVGWFGLDTYDADPAADWFWQSVGMQVMPHVGSVNNSVYCFYWSAQNAAYTLAQNDLNLKYIRSLPTAERKPMRPYFWNQLHGGGAGWRWWREQSLPTEEMRAITLLNAFTQYDGMVLWNWSATGDPNLPPPLVAERDVMLKDGAFVAADDQGVTRTFPRYDALHITSADDGGNLRFQLIDENAAASRAGVGPAFAYYNSTVAALMPHLRAPSESLAAMFEGLAMAKLVEWNLRHGEQVADFDAQQVYADTAPILRHIRNGDLHLIATYDPQVVYGQPARSISLNDFAGVAGLQLTFYADAEVRIYIIHLRDSD